MFVNDNHFDGWMEKLYGTVKEMGKDMKSLIHVDTLFAAQAADRGLYCICKTTVYAAAGKPPKRVLLLFAREPAPLRECTLVIHLPHGAGYTPEYTALTRDFYL
jgi:tRNA1(Val) A37 N6-methylase TrmN6